MSRPLYETPENRENEMRILQTIAAEWNVTPSPKLPMKNQLDYALLRNSGKMCPEVVCLVEIKDRSTMKKEWPTYYISLHKYMAALHYQAIAKVPALLVVQFPAPRGLQYVRFQSSLIEYVSMSNYVGRNDKDDNELVAHINMKHFFDIRECPIYFKGDD